MPSEINSIQVIQESGIGVAKDIAVNNFLTQDSDIDMAENEEVRLEKIVTDGCGIRKSLQLHGPDDLRLRPAITQFAKRNSSVAVASHLYDGNDAKG